MALALPAKDGWAGVADNRGGASDVYLVKGGL